MKTKHQKDFEKIYEKSRAYDSVKQTSHYPFGRKKGAGLIASPAFQEGWDRVFGQDRTCEPVLGPEPPCPLCEEG